MLYYSPRSRKREVQIADLFLTADQRMMTEGYRVVLLKKKIGGECREIPKVWEVLA